MAEQTTVEREYEETGHDDVVEITAVLYRLDIPYTLVYDGEYSFKLTIHVTGNVVNNQPLQNTGSPDVQHIAYIDPSRMNADDWNKFEDKVNASGGITENGQHYRLQVFLPPKKDD